MIAVVGAGNFANAALLPALAAARAPIKTIVSAGGLSGTAVAKKFGVPYSSTDYSGVLADPEIAGVVITTRHNLHASQVMDALRAGKHVLVEKPLCLTLEEFRAIVHTRNELAVAGAPTLAVGFNRRFSPHAVKMKNLLGDPPGALTFTATINAGAVPLEHWVHDPTVGGGRLVGEACHLVDFAQFVSGSAIESVAAITMEGTTDSASILLRHANGSISSINYFANGHRGVSKERIEVHSRGRTLLLDNFRVLFGYGFKSFKRLKTGQDKGHARQFALWAERIRTGGPALVGWAEVENTTLATLAIPRAIQERRWIAVSELHP